MADIAPELFLAICFFACFLAAFFVVWAFMVLDDDIEPDDIAPDDAAPEVMLLPPIEPEDMELPWAKAGAVIRAVAMAASANIFLMTSSLVPWGLELKRLALEGSTQSMASLQIIEPGAFGTGRRR